MTSVRERLLYRIIKKHNTDPLPCKFLLLFLPLVVENTKEYKKYLGQTKYKRNLHILTAYLISYSK